MASPSSRIARGLFLGSIVLLVAASASANIVWNWSFSSEAGTFVTNGNLTDLAGPFNFTILDFQVSSSVDDEDIGATYAGQDLPQGFLWDGSAPTQFYRAGGVFTNGANFFNASTGHFFTLVPSNIDSEFKTGDKALLDSGVLAIDPIDAIVPTLSPVMLGVLGVIVAAAAFRLLRN